MGLKYEIRMSKSEINSKWEIQMLEKGKSEWLWVERSEPYQPEPRRVSEGSTRKRLVALTHLPQDSLLQSRV